MLKDLNENFRESWIREYVHVHIMTTEDGIVKTARSRNAILTQEQKTNMLRADAGTEIGISIDYIPDNDLIDNPPRQMDFKLSFRPEKEASYPGGPEVLDQYLKERVVDFIPAGTFSEFQLAAVKFTIDEAGQVVDAVIFWSSEDEQIDALMLKAIVSMTDWNPAEYADGTRVKQEFAFTIGSMESCVVPLLNIRR